MFGFICVFVFSVLSDDVFRFVGFNCFSAMLIFALLVAKWPFCINKFDLNLI